MSCNSLERIGCTDGCNETYNSDSSLTTHRKEKHRYVLKKRRKPNGGTRLKNNCLQQVNTSREISFQGRYQRSTLQALVPRYRSLPNRHPYSQQAPTNFRIRHFLCWGLCKGHRTLFIRCRVTMLTFTSPSIRISSILLISRERFRHSDLIDLWILSIMPWRVMACKLRINDP